MVDDCSTDESGKIIDEYDAKYECCKAIHLEQNTGSANGPRNRGIKESTGDYIMFLDPDDRYTLDACETLYKSVKEYGADVAFGRFRRIFTYGDKVQKSYSPYIDDLCKNYPDEEFEDANPLNIPNFVWDNFLESFVYGKEIEGKYERNKEVDVLFVNSVEEEPDLLKMAPSVWAKIYKRELIIDNNIKYPPFICGDDMSFALESLINAKGIVFLNNFISYDYYIRDLPEDKSITNNVNPRLLNDLMDSYIYCRELTENNSKEVQNNSVTPHLFYWASTWKGGQFTKEENKVFLEKVRKLKKIHNTNLKNKFILDSIISMLKVAIAKK